MPNVDEAVQLCGGIASTADLLAWRIPRDWIRMAVNYGRIVRIRRGWFASLDTPPEAIEARRVGGRLACTSALEYHGVFEKADPALHVAVPIYLSRLRAAAGSRPVVVHWYRREPKGDALAVSVEEAWAQRARCRALHGSTDSL